MTRASPRACSECYGDGRRPHLGVGNGPHDGSFGAGENAKEEGWRLRRQPFAEVQADPKAGIGYPAC